MPVTQYITSDTDLMDLVCQYFPAADDVTPLMEKFMLTGLHTCGNLGASVMRLFTSNQDLGVLCNVGCCYHLIEEDNIRNPHLKPGWVLPDILILIHQDSTWIFFLSSRGTRFHRDRLPSEFISN